ncbi:hypothetical protein ABZ621_37525 [Streptomyces sp. NPDC007863]|uniref:hypothetical protein n=1 Tax=Streptomyces sp. NPDC007863 TaxID=3154894 RepID=UPI003404CEC2
MDTTPLGFPYPECDPPRVKDLSDIGQLRALAEAVDGVVQQIATDLNDQLVAPRAARMRESVASAWSPGTANPTLNQVIFASTGMGDTGAGGIRITRTGWYLIGMYALVIVGTGTEVNARPTILRNNANLLSFGDVGVQVTATAGDVYLSTTAELTAGDLLRPRIATNGADSFTVTSHMWALEVMAT